MTGERAVKCNRVLNPRGTYEASDPLDLGRNPHLIPQPGLFSGSFPFGLLLCGVCNAEDRGVMG